MAERGAEVEELNARRIRREFYDYIRKIEKKIPRNAEVLLSQEFVERENHVATLPGIVRASIERTLSEIAGTRVRIETDPKLPPDMIYRPFYNRETRTIHIPPLANTGMGLRLMAEHEAGHHRFNIMGMDLPELIEDATIETEIHKALLEATEHLPEKYARMLAEYAIMPTILPDTLEEFYAFSRALLQTKHKRERSEDSGERDKMLKEAIPDFVRYVLLPALGASRKRNFILSHGELEESARRILYDYVKLAEPAVRRVPKIVEELLKGNTDVAEKLFLRAHKKVLRLAVKRRIPVTVAHLAALEATKMLLNELTRRVGPWSSLFLDTYWRLISRATKRYVRALKRMYGP